RRTRWSPRGSRTSWPTSPTRRARGPDVVKVFGIGLSRTGTTSLTRALELLGYRAKHYPTAESHFEEYDALTDTPVPVRWRGRGRGAAVRVPRQAAARGAVSAREQAGRGAGGARRRRVGRGA